MSNATITPSVGTLTGSGSAPGLGFGVTPLLGALALAGGAPGLYYNVQGNTSVAPSAGRLALTTNVSQAITPPTGAIVVDQDAGSGVSYRPTVNSGISIVPAAGALKLTTFGTGATIIPGAGALFIMDPRNVSYSLFPGVGALGLVGAVPAQGGGYNITPFAGALGFDTDGANYVPGQLLTLPPPAPGALALAGHAPLVGAAAVRISEPAGVLVLQGYPPVLSIRRYASPSAGALGLAGNAPNLILGYGIAPPAGALFAIGSLAYVSVTRTPAASAIALRGAAPIIRQGKVLIVPSGALALPGNAPGRVAIQPVCIPQPGAVGMAGYAPIISTSQTVQPPYGVLGIYGRAPIVEAPVQITPFPGALGLAGNQPAQAPTAFYQVDPYYYVAGRTVGATVTWPPLSASESVIGAFNFGDELENGELLLGPINLTIQVAAGADSNPNHIVNGALTLDPTQMIVFVPIANGTPGVTYYLIVNVQTTNPYKKLSRYALLPIVAAATPSSNSVNTTVAPDAGGIVTVGTSAGRTP